MSFPQVHIVRHGQTAWSLSGQHTGRSDIPLTAVGEEEARRVGQLLQGLTFDHVWTSPSQRARRTCELAGFGAIAKADDDLQEWDYGQYEGLLSAEIHGRNPDWQIFRDGSPGGESVADVTARADRIIARLRSTPGEILIFSSSHFIRVLTARWLGMETAGGRYFLPATGSHSILGYEHSLAEPVVARWSEKPRG